MNIDEVQRRLWEQSRAHRQHRESGTPLFPTNPYGGRIRNLMDLVHNPTWIAAACEGGAFQSCRSNWSGKMPSNRR
jgi:hypothetical protein